MCFSLLLLFSFDSPRGDDDKWITIYYAEMQYECARREAEGIRVHRQYVRHVFSIIDSTSLWWEINSVWHIIPPLILPPLRLRLQVMCLNAILIANLPSCGIFSWLFSRIEFIIRGNYQRFKATLCIIIRKLEYLFCNRYLRGKNFCLSCQWYFCLLI